VNLDDLEARFDAGATIGLEEFKATGLAKQRDVPVKILGRGELSKSFTVNVHKISASARSAIESAGGTVQLIED
jgi:large subunit ribosomal protein L15